MLQRGNTLFFIIYLIAGLYFLNAPFNLIPLPAISPWIAFIGGVLLVLASIKHLFPFGIFNTGY